MKKVFLIAILFLVSVAVNRMAAAVIYVDSSGHAGLNNGTSWGNAFLSLQSALDAAVSGDEIWVAKGTYKPSHDYGLGGGSRYYHFRMKNGVAIYGGFAGTETAVSQRTDFRAGGANVTILSGDLNGDDVVTGAGATLNFSNNGENCYHVFYHPAGLGLTTTAVLNGFSITGGHANGTGIHSWGGGFLNYSATLTLNDLAMYNNFATYVGGVFANSSSSVMVTNSFIQNNYSQNGGAMYSLDSPASYFTNVIISGNKAEMGGGIANVNAPCSLTNVTVTNNYAGWAGGGLYSAYNAFSLMNCIVWGNQAGSAGTQIGVFQGGSMTFNYSCFENRTNYIYNDGGSIASSNSINLDPLFANVAYTDYRIAGTSPCADAGNDSYIAELYDIRGTAYDRKLDKTTGETGTVDMGAFEYKAGADPLIPCNNPLSGGVIAGDQGICEGSLPSPVSNTTSPSGYSGTIEFKWQLSTTGNSSGFTDIPGASDSVFQPPVPGVTTWYKRLARVNCMSDWSGAAESNAVQVTVNPVYSFTDTVGICEGDSLVWHDSTFTTPGTYIKSYQTKEGCDSIFTLNLAVNPEYSFTEDRDICAGDSIIWQDSIYATTGTHMVSYKTNKGCDSIYVLNLTLHPLPMDLPDITGLVVSDTLCENESTEVLLFSSQKGISYQLKKNGTDAGSPQKGNEATLAFLTGPLSSTSQFTIEATDTASACSIVLDTVLTITINPLPTVTEASAMPESLCVSGQAVFSATASSGDISWYDAATDGNDISILNPVIDTSTTYYAEAISPEGCISLNRTPVTAYVHPAYFFAEEHEICNDESYTWHGNTYSVAGTYITIYTTSNGCDSIYRLKLSVKPAYNFTQSHVICNGDSVIWRGNTYRTSGIYTEDYLTREGCDSIFTLNLTVNTVDISVIQNGNTLTAGVTGAGYRWLNCADNYSILTDETNRDFHPAADGLYAVEVTQNSCVDTSDCFIITITGDDPPESSAIKLYPNPVTDELIIEAPVNDEWHSIEMINAFGQVVYQNYFMNNTSIPAGHLTPGVYMIKIETGKTLTVRKIIKQ